MAHAPPPDRMSGEGAEQSPARRTTPRRSPRRQKRPTRQLPKRPARPEHPQQPRPVGLPKLLIAPIFASRYAPLFAVALREGDPLPDRQPMALDYIRIRGARTHNLKNIDLDLPRDKLIVITGLSGSGKSSLAFDTIYAEGQRRYVESLSAYARQFLSVMEKPDVDHIEGLSPAIAIEQKATSHNPRSTVGTVTEIYDYLRVLYARAGVPRCPEHCQELTAQTVSQMVDQVLALPEGTSVLLLAPVVQDRKGEHLETLDQLRSQGFVRVRVDGELHEI